MTGTPAAGNNGIEKALKTLTVIQHTSAEYLGLIEDHLEGRGTRFRYFRPFTSDGKLPAADALGDGLILLSGGPWGCAGDNDLPSLADELAIARAALSDKLPVLGLGLGAQILAMAAGASQPQAAPLTMSVQTATRSRADALGGYLPEHFPMASYGRDQVGLPAGADVLATLADGNPAIWQLGEAVFGFAGHPGFKSGMVEDLIMEFDVSPDGVGERLGQLRQSQDEIADALVPIMTGLVAACDWMS